MRIRFIVPDAYRVGGTVRTVFNLSGALARDHQVEVASLARSRAQPALAPPPGVQLVPLQDARGLIAYIRAAQDGVLIGTRPRINLALALLAPPGVLAVGQEHFHLAHHPLRKRVAMQCMYHRLDAHVSLTHGDAAAYRRLLRHDAMVRCIPNGVGDPGVAPAATMTPVAVSAGRLSRQKGFDLLLVAWSDVVKVHPDWTLRIFGEGEQRRHLESLIDQLDIAAHVELAGFTDRLQQEFAQSSFFVLSSRFEGLPMVLLEAMSCGLPVVSFDCPTGPSDVVEPGVDGFLVPPEDVGALSHEIISMIEMGDQRRQMADAAYTKSLAYRIPAVAAQWETMFDELRPNAGSRRQFSRKASRPR